MSNNELLNKLKAPKEEAPKVGAGNVPPEEALADTLSKLNNLPKTGGIHTGMTSSTQHVPASQPSEPVNRLPGYYTMGFGVVRLARNQVIKSSSIGGQFYYPLNSPAAKFLEARVGNGVTKVTE